MHYTKNEAKFLSSVYYTGRIFFSVIIFFRKDWRAKGASDKVMGFFLSHKFGQKCRNNLNKYWLFWGKVISFLNKEKTQNCFYFKMGQFSKENKRGKHFIIMSNLETIEIFYQLFRIWIKKFFPMKISGKIIFFHQQKVIFYSIF